MKLMSTLAENLGPFFNNQNYSSRKLFESHTKAESGTFYGYLRLSNQATDVVGKGCGGW